MPPKENDFPGFAVSTQKNGLSHGAVIFFANSTPQKVPLWASVQGLRQKLPQVLGTTGFAAPEQYGLSQSDIRTDIYAMGILINVMLTGEHPSRKLAEGKMGRIVDRCTHVNPQRRYKNVLRLMEAL